MTEQSRSDLQAELDAVRKRLGKLEATQSNSKVASNSERRQGFSKRLVFGLAPFLGLLFLKGNGTVYRDGPVVVKGFGAKYNTCANVAYLQLIPYLNNYAAWREAGAPSDERLKTDLRQIPNAVDKVRRLRGVTYHWNERGLQSLTGDIESSISAGPNATEEENQKLWQTARDKRYKELASTLAGVIAQDVEAVLPEAVTTDEAGYKSVQYHYLIPLLIEALKEQDKTVKDQAQIVAQQQQEIARLTTANLAVQQQLADLAAVKAQVAQLDAAMRRIPAMHLSDASPESSR